MIEVTDEIDEFGQRWAVAVIFGERHRLLKVDRPLDEEAPARQNDGQGPEEAAG